MGTQKEISITWNGDKVLKDFKKKANKAMKAVALFISGRAKANSPVDTGRLRNSIKPESGADFVKVGSNLDYAKHVEEGTSKSKAQPFVSPAFETETNAIDKILNENLKNE